MKQIKYKIEVTAEDIELGMPFALSAVKCPVFRAMKRVVPKMKAVGAVTARAQNTTFMLPPEITKKIENFAYGERCEPFSFEVGGTEYD
jgi:hypothetical protein